MQKLVREGQSSLVFVFQTHKILRGRMCFYLPKSDSHFIRCAFSFVHKHNFVLTPSFIHSFTWFKLSLCRVVLSYLLTFIPTHIRIHPCVYHINADVNTRFLRLSLLVFLLLVPILSAYSLFSLKYLC